MNWPGGITGMAVAVAVVEMFQATAARSSNELMGWRVLPIPLKNG